MCQEARRQAQGQTIKYSSPSFYTLFLVHYVTNASRLSARSPCIPHELLFGIQTELLRSRKHLESDNILIPVWIRNVWITQHTEIKHWVTYLHMWRREHVWDTLLVLSLRLVTAKLWIFNSPLSEKERDWEMRRVTTILNSCMIRQWQMGYLFK